jgi:hypothetical protein
VPALRQLGPAKFSCHVTCQPIPLLPTEVVPCIGYRLAIGHLRCQPLPANSVCWKFHFTSLCIALHRNDITLA